MADSGKILRRKSSCQKPLKECGSGGLGRWEQAEEGILSGGTRVMAWKRE